MDLHLLFTLNVMLYQLGFPIVIGYEVNLLNTATATSNLKGWLINTYVNGAAASNSSSHGWEELSFNSQMNKIARGYQVCPKERDESQSHIQSWLRTPLLDVAGVLRIYIELRFWMRECRDLKDTFCRETFKVYYRFINENINSYGDDWTLNETYYSTIDTVAAESRFLPGTNPEDLKINTEIVSLKLESNDRTSNLPESDGRNSVYVAIVDEGACMALTSIRIYYNVCPQVVAGLAQFPKTFAGPRDTSLITVEGKCVENSMLISSHSTSEGLSPLYHCSSSGAWQVRTRFCQCNPGYEPDDVQFSCNECPFNASKSDVGNGKCTPCPPNSFTIKRGALYCQCLARDNNFQSIRQLSGAKSLALQSDDCEFCSRVPSSPTRLSLATNLLRAPDSIELSWEPPRSSGRCRKITYCVVCVECPFHGEGLLSTSKQPENSDTVRICDTGSLSINRSLTQRNCQELAYFPSKCDNEKLYVTVRNFREHTRYKFLVIAINGVTVKQYAQVFEALKSSGKGFKNEYNYSAYHLLLSQQLSDLATSSGASILYSPSRDPLPPTISHLQLVSKNQSSVTVTWHPPVFISGELLGYQVKWSSTNRTRNNQHHTSTSLHNISTSIVKVSGTTAVLVGLRPDSQYEIAIRAENSAGMGNYSVPLQVTTARGEYYLATSAPTPSSVMYNPIYLIATLAAIVILIIIALLVLIKCLNTKNKFIAAVLTTSQIDGSVTDIVETETPAEYTYPSDAEQRTYVDPFSLGALLPSFTSETVPDHITTDNVIGTGEFGEVYQGTLSKKDCHGNNYVIDVAVKQLHAQCQPHEQLDFLREAMALATFQHPNIIKLEAVVTASRPYMIVTELMKHGCLGAFLRNHQEAGLAFPSIVLVRMLRGVACGMAYLSQLRYIHRDLAARNVLINEELVCKVADFGLTRKLEDDNNENDPNRTYTTQGGKIAIRWAAPEAIAYRAYSQASDIWSFGVFAWEVTTYGEKPYWSLTNQQILQALNEGFRLPAPEDCPSVLHQLMLECWHAERGTRPTFVQVVARLDDIIDNSGVLNTLASPASTGAEEMFFAESPPHSPAPLPIVPDAQAHHNYATCRIASEDKLSFTSLISKTSSTASLHSCAKTTNSHEDNGSSKSEMMSFPCFDSKDESTESTSMLSSSSGNLHRPVSSSSPTVKLINGNCFIKLPNGEGSVKFVNETSS